MKVEAPEASQKSLVSAEPVLREAPVSGTLNRRRRGWGAGGGVWKDLALDVTFYLVSRRP